VSAENSGKPLGGLDSSPNPAGGVHSALAGGKRAAAPNPRTPPPLVLWLFSLPLPHNEKSGDVLGLQYRGYITLQIF